MSLFLVLIFGCLFPQNQSAGSYFAMFLFAGFYCIAHDYMLIDVSVFCTGRETSGFSGRCFKVFLSF